MTNDGWLDANERRFYVEKLTLEYDTFDDTQLRLVPHSVVICVSPNLDSSQWRGWTEPH